MVSAEAILKLQDEATCTWHTPGQPGNDAYSADSWLSRVAQQHRANFDLWHIEDEARRTGATM